MKEQQFLKFIFFALSGCVAYFNDIKRGPYHTKHAGTTPNTGTYTFSFPKAALLLVSTKNRDLWAGPAPENCDSRTFLKSDRSDWLRIRNENSAHAQKIGSDQRSRFLLLTKRSAASGNENVSTSVW